MNIPSREQSSESKSGEDPPNAEVAVKMASLPNCAVVTVKTVKPPNSVAVAVKKVNLLDRVVVTAKMVNPPNRVVVFAKWLPSRMTGAVTARRIRLTHICGPALCRNNGMQGRAVGKPAEWQIAKNGSHLNISL